MQRSFLHVVFILAIISSLAWGTKPIRTIQVSLDGKLYDIHDVTTVSELQERLQEVSGMKNETMWNDSQILFRGKTLKNTDILRRVGVKDGAALAVTFNSSNANEEDSARSSSSSSKKQRRSKNRKNSHKDKNNPKKRNNNNYGGWGASFSSSPFTGSHNPFGTNGNGSSSSSPKTPLEWMKDENLDWNDIVESLKSITREDVASLVREFLTLGYNQMRDFWNDPTIRGIFNDPAKTEVARQLCLSNPELRTSIEGVPGGKKILNDQQAWNTYFQTLGEVARSAGDTILDGLLDVLIEILKSSSTSSSSSSSNVSGTLNGSNTPRTGEASFQSETIDPSIASNVLFELSESEDEDY